MTSSSSWQKAHGLVELAPAAPRLLPPPPLLPTPARPLVSLPAPPLAPSVACSGASVDCILSALPSDAAPNLIREIVESVRGGAMRYNPSKTKKILSKYEQIFHIFRGVSSPAEKKNVISATRRGCKVTDSRAGEL